VALAKASLQAISPKGKVIPFQFNPTQYTFDASNQLAEIGIPGLRAPVLQYVRGASRMLALELLFDAYADVDYLIQQTLSVTAKTEEIYGLLAPTNETGAPPICNFAWEDRRLQCVVERVSGRYTMFCENGAPVRATLAVTLREYVQATVTLRRGTAAALKTHEVKAGDSLMKIAQAEYSNMNLWRRIATANAIASPLDLQVGAMLIIPSKDSA
jgi:nucleoid-associated protein YgaU